MHSECHIDVQDCCGNSSPRDRYRSRKTKVRVNRVESRALDVEAIEDDMTEGWKEDGTVIRLR
jgi:hypothetical protein